MTAQNRALIRASISFPSGVYEPLETIAKEKRGVVREAPEKYIEGKLALLEGHGSRDAGIL